MATVTPDLTAIYTVMRAFIIANVGGAAVQGVPNRVAMPQGAFVAMTAILHKRLNTNIHRYVDDVVPLPVHQMEIEQHVQLTMQLDCYGANSNEVAAILSTLLRDEYGCLALAPVAQPLYCNDPKFAPLVNGEKQYEKRWIVDAVLQYNPVVVVPMEFADAAIVELIDVDVAYPPT